VKRRFDELIGRALTRWVGLVLANAPRVVGAALVLTLFLLGYTVAFLGINSDNVSLVAEDVPSRRALDEFAELFPILNNALLLVVDAETPELARDAASELEADLSRQTDQFTNVFIPGGGDFFERNGLLYRSVDDLYDFTDHMALVQPMIAELERDSSIANVAVLVRAGLERVSLDDRDSEHWAAVLDRVSSAASGAFDEFPMAISWEEFLLSGSSLDVSTRRVLMVEPVLDFDTLLPAGPALERIRDTARELGLTREQGVVVRVTGNPALNHEEMLGMAWDIVAGGAFCFLFVVFVLYLALRSMRLVAAAVATLLVGLVWTAAFATAAVGHLNLISIAFGVLFIGLGVDFTIHFGMSYASMRREGLEHSSAALAAVDFVGSSLVLCTLTTSIGFYVFIPTDYLGVAELGLISGTGMLIILFLTLTFFPALLTAAQRLPEGEAPRASLRFRGDAGKAIARHAGAVRWIALATGIGALCLLPYASFDPNVVQMRNPSAESVQVFNELAATNQRGSPWYANALAPDLDAARELAARLRDLELVSDAVTLADYIPEDQEEKREILADLSLIIDTPETQRTAGSELSEEEQLLALRKMRDYLTSSGVGRGDSKLQASVGRLEDVLDEFLARVDSEGDVVAALESLEETLLGQLPVHMDRLRNALDPAPIDLESLPRSVVRRMIAPDGRARVIAYPRENLQSGDEALTRFVDAVRSVAPNATGLTVNIVEFGRVTVQSLRQALVSALLAIALLLWLLWRRVGEMLLVLTPLLLGAALTAASMVVLGIPFNFANVIVIPLLLGIGVDSGIHLVHRANVEPDSEEGLLATTTARAVFYSAATTIASFGALAFSSHRGIASLGITLVLGMGFVLLTTLVVLPALIEWRRTLRKPESALRASS
jgi:hopanoid biosynthesis associated RND transporter like protein HpnN